MQKQQLEAITNFGLEDGYASIAEVMEDRDYLEEELGYNVDEIILNFFEIIGVQKFIKEF